MEPDPMNHCITIARTLTKISRGARRAKSPALIEEIEDQLRQADEACRTAVERCNWANARLVDFERRNAPAEILEMARANRERWLDALCKLDGNRHALTELWTRARAVRRVTPRLPRPQVRIVRVRQRARRARVIRTVARVAAKTTSTGDPDPEPDSSARTSNSGGAS